MLTWNFCGIVRLESVNFFFILKLFIIIFLHFFVYFSACICFVFDLMSDKIEMRNPSLTEKILKEISNTFLKPTHTVYNNASTKQKSIFMPLVAPRGKTYLIWSVLYKMWLYKYFDCNFKNYLFWDIFIVFILRYICWFILYIK